MNHPSLPKFKTLGLCFLLGAISRGFCHGEDLRIAAFDQSLTVTWTNVFTNAITTVEQARLPTGPWLEVNNYYGKGPVGHATVLSVSGSSFYRLLQVDISGTPQGGTNLFQSYGLLSTMAGIGAGGVDGVNYWQATFEGGLATAAGLSRPHIAMADHEGNIFIADKDSHSILKVTLDGRIHTVAGTHVAGFNGDGPALATSLKLFQPNGLHVHGNGSFDILDTGNGKVRHVDTNGVMTTLFTVPGGIATGRGLWVKKDESEVYFCSGTELKKWTATNGVTLVKSGFKDLGNLDLDSTGHVFVTDRGDNKVFRISNSGNRSVVAGNGTKTGGGDGFPAVQTGLWGVRGICFLPNDGYLLATHEGSQVWYVDPAGIIHLFLDGQTIAHSGDGEWFHSTGLKVSQPRQITIMDNGDLLITENDLGYIRRIGFHRIRN